MRVQLEELGEGQRKFFEGGRVGCTCSRYEMGFVDCHYDRTVANVVEC